MLKFDPGKNETALRFSCFGGIGKEKPDKNALMLSNCDNLRVLADGTLRRRDAVKKLCTLPSTPRGYFYGSINGATEIIAVCGTSVCSIDPETFEASVVSTLAGDGEVFFFVLDGRLMLLDGSDIYYCDGGLLTAVHGYVPLLYSCIDKYGSEKEYIEPENLLTPQIRVRFINEASVSTYYIKEPLRSVDAVYINGIKYAAAAYTVSIGSFSTTLTFKSTVTIGAEIIVVCTHSSSDRSLITALDRAVVYGGDCDSRVFCYKRGGTDMYYSRPLTASDTALAEKYASDSDGIYFPATDVFAVGGGRDPVTAACRHRDSLLIFTARETFRCDFTSNDTDVRPVTPVSALTGCSLYDGALSAGEYVFFVYSGRLWKWETSTYVRDEDFAVSVSDGIESLLSGAANVFYDQNYREFYVHSPSASTTLVLNVQNGVISTYSGFCADSFFSLADGSSPYSVGFIRGADVFVFDPSLANDPDDTPIPIELVTRDIDFGDGESAKRLWRSALTADGGSVQRNFTLTFSSSYGSLSRSLVCPAANERNEPYVFALRSDIGKFRRLRVMLYAASGDIGTIRSLSLYAASL